MAVHTVPLKAAREPHKSTPSALNPSPAPDPIQGLVQALFSGLGYFNYAMEDQRGHLHCIKSIRLSSGDQLVLKTSPSARTQLLRHQRHCLHTEAFIFSLLAKSRLPVPRVVMFDSTGVHLKSPFLLTTHMHGVRLADVRQHLTRSELSSIERQISSLASIIGQHTSSKFGRVGVAKGHDSWREAFFDMMESVLMDGEDKWVSLPYAQIREATARLDHALDEVKEARLIVMGLGSPENVLISRRTNEVTGLTDFGNAVWGDCAMMENGVHESPKRLLYICYEAIVTIVASHYRVADESTELDARKALTTALMTLSLEFEGRDRTI